MIGATSVGGDGLPDVPGVPPGRYVGAFRGAADHRYGGQLSPWSTTMPGVSPTAWAYFAFAGDPLWHRVPGTVWLPVTVRRGVF